jgi:hypothetical protein
MRCLIRRVVVGECYCEIRLVFVCWLVVVRFLLRELCCRVCVYCVRGTSSPIGAAPTGSACIARYVVIGVLSGPSNIDHVLHEI